MVTEMGPNMPKVNVAVVVGSNRRESVNRKLARALARLGEGKLTTRSVQIDDLPMFNQDQENPLPASAARFKAEIGQANALLIVTPEHNRSIPAVLNRLGREALRPELLGRKTGRNHGHLSGRHRHGSGATASAAGVGEFGGFGHGRRSLCQLQAAPHR